MSDERERIRKKWVERWVDEIDLCLDAPGRLTEDERRELGWIIVDAHRAALHKAAEYLHKWWGPPASHPSDVILCNVASILEWGEEEG